MDALVVVVEHVVGALLGLLAEAQAVVLVRAVRVATAAVVRRRNTIYMFTSVHRA